MKVKERKKTTKTPTITYDPALDKFDGKILFKEKYDWAVKFLQDHPFPEELLKGKK